MINFSKRKKFRFEQQDVLPTAFLIMGSCFTLLTVAYLKLLLDYHVLTKNSYSNLVQMNDGNSFIAIKAQSKYYRSSESIQSYIANWLNLHYTFSGSITQTNGKAVPDQGVSVNIAGKSFRVPINTYNSSFALVPEARNPYLAVVVEKWVDPAYFSGSSSIITSEVIIDEMGLPQEIKHKGNKIVWEVPVIAKIVYHSPDGNQSIKYLQRKFIVKAIDVPTSAPQKSSSIYQKLTYEWSKQGLQIIGIKKYE